MTKQLESLEKRYHASSWAVWALYHAVDDLANDELLSNLFDETERYRKLEWEAKKLNALHERLSGGWWALVEASREINARNNLLNYYEFKRNLIA